LSVQELSKLFHGHHENLKKISAFSNIMSCNKQNIVDISILNKVRNKETFLNYY